MTEIILNDPIAVRRCILLEFLSGKPIWNCYRNFCYNLGKESIEYQEFEYWFMRFSNKEFELDYDRSKDPPTRNLSDLPLEILHEILGNLNGKQRPQKYYANELNHFEVALNDLEAFLNQPKLELEKLEIVKVDKKYRDDFGAMFQKLHQKVKTKELHILITEETEELQILPYLDPSFIEKIHLKINEGSKNRIDKILELEQCRNVKMIELKLDFDGIEQFHVENFMMFKRFSLILEIYDMNAKQFIGIVETLLTSTSLELVYLNFYRSDLFDPIKTELDNITVKISENSKIRKLLVPNSKEYFETELIGNTVVRIERKI
ncbi:hypothetical protein CAEBREN_09170 [Caenorhabditis brenneri]|uniref:Mos1 transposase HTH domain-containing protein n=1 Tax=Caenorhabditis brenneri TaxID=135651 RepID=G0NN08_CAEBE|nr:hypothetical protein CAEBREN_09170 [Caenorhabditis brenneri]